MARSRKNVYSREIEVYKKAQEFLDQEDVATEDFKPQYIDLVSEYKEILDQAKLITKVSDKLQNKLNNANEALAVKNFELQKTIDELTKARAGRRATTIVFILGIVFFILSDGLIDIYIIPTLFSGSANNNLVSLLIKGVFALLLKPIESFVEKRLLTLAYKQESEKKERDLKKGK